MTRQSWYQPASRAQTFNMNRPSMVPNVLLLHTTEGNGWEGYSGGGTAPHFTYRAKTREWRQHFPVDVAAMGLADAPGGVATNRLNVVQVEIADCTSGWASDENPSAPYRIGLKAQDLSDENLRDLADLWRWLNREWDVPFTVTPRGFKRWNADRPTMSDSEWNAFRGLCGHQHVPENSHSDPGLINAAKLLAFAKGESAAPAVPATPTGPTVTDGPTGWVLREGHRDSDGLHFIEDTLRGLYERRRFTINPPAIVGPALDAGDLGNIADFQRVEGLAVVGGLDAPTLERAAEPMRGICAGSYEAGNPIDCRYINALLGWAGLLDWGRAWSDVPQPDGVSNLQRSLGNDVDGHLGPKQLTALMKRVPGRAFNIDDFDNTQLTSAPPAEARAAVGSTYVRPADPKYPITAAYGIPGRRLWQAGHHTGVDIGVPEGTPIYATIGGDVRQNRSWGPAYGNMLLINDDLDGSDWGYCHLSRHAVSDGEKVKTGQLIGWSGATGHVTGPHLHLERRPRGGGYGSDRNPNLWP